VIVHVNDHKCTFDRLHGYRRALLDAGSAFDSVLVARGDWSATSGYEASQRLRALPEIHYKDG
jgi:DNA-binding LacI/PurR family transcriptional regulator